jgi:hypothetical protein
MSAYFKAGIGPNISPSTMMPSRIGGSTNGYLASFCKWMCVVDGFLGGISSLGNHLVEDEVSHVSSTIGGVVGSMCVLFGT